MTKFQRAKGFVFWIVLVAVVGIGTVWAVNPSGPGQTTSTKSLSVVPASDAVFTVSGTIGGTTPDGGFATNGTLVSTQASALTALNLLTQPRTTTTVTKSDSTDTSSYCTKGFDVGTAGNVAVIGCDDSYDAGTAPILKNIPSGTFKAGCFKRIMSTNTTASDIVCYGGTG